MPKKVSQGELDSVLQAVAQFPKGASLEDVSGVLEIAMPRRTLQRRLALLVEQGQLTVLEAIDVLLNDECANRETRRIKAARMTARLEEESADPASFSGTTYVEVVARKT